MSQSSGISKVGVNKLKSILLEPALTSNYLCEINFPPNLSRLITETESSLLNLSCSEVSLPGSSVATFEIDNDYHGVTQRHGYRRIYDDRMDFTFYVDSNYKIITLFEDWINYVTGQYNLSGTDKNDTRNKLKNNYTYSVNYPKFYKSDSIMITKFERSLKGKALRYTFKDAFPVSINSMPISYDASQLLKVTVSISYSRYLVNIVEYNNSKPEQDTSGGGSDNSDGNDPNRNAGTRSLVPVRGNSGVVFFDANIDTRTTAEVNRRFFDSQGRPVIN